MVIIWKNVFPFKKNIVLSIYKLLWLLFNLYTYY